MSSKLGFVRNEVKEETPEISGPICSINPQSSGGLLKGGAVTSAFVSAFL